MIEAAPSNGSATRRLPAYAPPLAVLAAALALGTVGASLWQPPAPRPEALAPQPTLSESPTPDRPAGAPGEGSQRADAPDLPVAPLQGPLGGPLSRWAWTGQAPAVEPAPDAAAPEARADAQAETQAGTQAETQAPEPPRTVMTVPLPVPRPPELRRPLDAPRRERLARRPDAAPAAPPEDNRSFLEKLFGIEATPARSYAALESKPADLAPRIRISPPVAPPSGGGAAVYNIAARTVTLPSGERLEAHSGLGEIMDDPRHVNVRMRGATPPGTYALTEREQLFHGVRAIRLTPVGGSEAVYGRVGLLAHTYMLGPNGQSNGCVSFRDYERFLQAYLRGEIQSLVVVAGTQDALPGLAEARPAPVRMARN